MPIQLAMAWMPLSILFSFVLSFRFTNPLKHAKLYLMSTDAKQPTSDKPVPSKNTALLVFGAIADTTWRMFVPAVGGAILGVLADRTWGTKPWVTVAGITLGVIIAGLLVWLQLKDTKGESSK